MLSADADDDALGVSAGADEEELVAGVPLELSSLLPQAAVARTRARADAARPARTIFLGMTRAHFRCTPTARSAADIGTSARYWRRMGRARNKQLRAVQRLPE